MQAQMSTREIVRRAISRQRHNGQSTALEYTDLRILDKRQQLVPLQLNRVQQHLLANLTGRDLILKARQMGVTTAIQAWFFLTALTTTARTVTYTHLDDSTAYLRDMVRLFFDNLPVDKQRVRSAANATMTKFPTTNSTMYTGTAGSPESGRAGSFSHLHGSEVAFWKNGERLLSGVMQAIPMDYGHIVLESTANGQQGWFYAECMRALHGDSLWKLHFYPWWWDDGYRAIVPDDMALTDEERALATAHGLDDAQMAWRRIKQFELGENFQREYPEDILSAFAHSAKGLVYPNFASENITDRAEYQPGAPVFWGLDDGYAHGGGRGTVSYHPRIVLFAQANEWGGVNVFDEIAVTGEHAEATIAAALAKPYARPEWIFIDSSASECKLRAWEQGLQTVGATHSVSEGIKNLRRLVCDPAGTRLLRIHPRCANTIYEFGQYRYVDTGASNVGEPRPLKQDDHSMDALRYLTYYLAKQS